MILLIFECKVSGFFFLIVCGIFHAAAFFFSPILYSKYFSQTNQLHITMLYQTLGLLEAHGGSSDPAPPDLVAS